MQACPSAMPTFVPVAQAPIENALIAKSRSVGYVYRTQLDVFRCTSWSSFAECSQLYALPDDPADSSISVPATGIRPSRQRSANP